jgi:hypothetical protein
MRLQSTHGISKLMFIILLLAALIVGATLSYVWTMGYYASKEYQLPEKTSISIEAVEFSAQNTTFFDVVILNPSYSPSSVNITQIAISTGGVLQNVEVLPSLPYSLSIGSSLTFKGLWNWANYTGQTIKVIVFVAEGSGATVQAEIPSYVELTVEAYFDSSISLQHFNVTVRNAETSVTYVNITKLTIDGETILFKNITVNSVPVSFPYSLNSNQSVTFKCEWNWMNYQGKSVKVTVWTLQGYTATWQKEV